jgi:hypothetical protein
MTVLTGTDTGGSDILSYSLEWDSGSGGASFTPLIGYSTNSLVLVFT